MTVIRDQEETAKQQGAQPPAEEARTPEVLPRSETPSNGRADAPDPGDREDAPKAGGWEDAQDPRSRAV
ncbi:hypothetical protein ACH4UN_03150, partial [Streptomyces hygroscopicus]